MDKQAWWGEAGRGDRAGVKLAPHIGGKQYT